MKINIQLLFSNVLIQQQNDQQKKNYTRIRTPVIKGNVRYNYITLNAKQKLTKKSTNHMLPLQDNIANTNQ